MFDYQRVDILKTPNGMMYYGRIMYQCVVLCIMELDVFIPLISMILCRDLYGSRIIKWECNGNFTDYDEKIRPNFV